MPVTFNPASHLANSITDAKQVTADELLRTCSPEAERQCEEILQSFLGRGPFAKDTILSKDAFRLSHMRHGLVQTVCEAYLEHRALVLRPDDVWLAILTQFSMYVNEHAEELRDKFVAHKGKKELIVYAAGTRHTVDFGDMAVRMTNEMDKFIVDRALRDWILPSFSTTTENDTVVASVAMMATMKAYFEYSFGITCGIPKVTLEGDKADWEDLLRRARKLMEYGEETTAWYALLRPVLVRFVRAFDLLPNTRDNLDFWNHAVFHQQTGCGDPTEFALTGWLSAFCVFSDKGKWIGRPVKTVLSEWYDSPAGSNEMEKKSAQSALSDTTTLGGTALEYDKKQWIGVLRLDGMTYHHLHGGAIPPSIVEVDVKVIDNGVPFPSIMVAGIVGASVLDSGSTEVSSTGVRDTIAPATGWWLYTKKGVNKNKLNDLLSRMPDEKGGMEVRKAGDKLAARVEGKDSQGRRDGVSSMRKWARRVLVCFPL
ncbi:unnamed protein product [Peniophora sp. CBMAI 1063]|nr:unnamed protein product [Peniophora sp. CBMAI 1063]